MLNTLLSSYLIIFIVGDNVVELLGVGAVQFSPLLITELDKLRWIGEWNDKRA